MCAVHAYHFCRDCPGNCGWNPWIRVSLGTGAFGNALYHSLVIVKEGCLAVARGLGGLGLLLRGPGLLGRPGVLSGLGAVVRVGGGGGGGGGAGAVVMFC